MNKLNGNISTKILGSILFFAMIVSIYSCGLRVYFNTFYNAKNYYNQAKYLRKQAALQGRDTLAVGLVELDSAIVRCGRIIQMHPNSAFIDDALFIMGDAFLMKGEFQNALGKFEEIVKFYPHSPFVSQAYLKAGISYTLRGEYNNAQTYFARAKTYEDNNINQQARYYQIKSFILAEDYSLAEKEIDEFFKLYPRSEYVLLILLEQAELLFNQEKWQELRELYQTMNDIIDEDNMTVYYQTTLRFAQALQHLNQNQEAIAVLQDLRSNLPSGTRDAEAAIEIAVCYRNLENYDIALQILNEVNTSYPRTQQAAKALYLIGEIYEKDYFDFNQAKAFYEEARLSNPDQSTLSLAMQRSLSLTKIIQYQQALDTAQQPGDLKFLLAELYYYELEDEARAQQAYLDFLSNYPQSSYYPKAMLVYANMIYSQGEIIQADSIYQQVIENYPDSEYADYAFRKLYDEVPNQTEP
ncbi:MAG: tetratricopeptide repeat protein [bacterium]